MIIWSLAATQPLPIRRRLPLRHDVEDHGMDNRRIIERRCSGSRPLNFLNEEDAMFLRIQTPLDAPILADAESTLFRDEPMTDDWSMLEWALIEPESWWFDRPLRGMTMAANDERFDEATKSERRRQAALARWRGLSEGDINF